MLHLTPASAEETSGKLRPDLPDQLKRKMDMMNAHREDYKQLIASPNHFNKDAT